MEKYHLCKHCISNFKSNSCIHSCKTSECHICSGALEQIDGLVQGATKKAKKFEWKTFSVSSSFPKQSFINEQQVADLLSPGHYTSLKNSANALLAKKISQQTGKKNIQRQADANFGFNFITTQSSAEPSPIHIFGHYIKLSRSHCQSKWHCSKCGGKGCDSCKGTGKNYPSVEEEIGNVLKEEFLAKGFTLHASGREDVDVRAIGTGRPFVMELSFPKKRQADLKALEQQFSENENVQAIGMRIVQRHFIDAICSSHFDKTYSAVVSAQRPFTKNDEKKAESLSGRFILQQTPKRVLARRADMKRKRKITEISAKALKSGKLHMAITAEAGTYIKELISSDSGRTKPSITEVLGCKASCDELDVVAIHDYFLETLLDD